MGITTEELLLQQSIPNNFISRIEALEREFALYKNAAPVAGVVSDWASDLGDIVAGNLIMGNGVPLGEGFTGLYQSAEQFEWPVGSGDYWNFGGFNTDVIQVGISALTGYLLGGGGTVGINEEGLRLTNIADDDTSSFLFADAGVGDIGSITQNFGDRLSIRYQPYSGGEYLSNPGFESGSFTNWTTAGAGTWSVQTTTVYRQDYAAKLAVSGTAAHTLTSDRVNTGPLTSMGLLCFYQYTGIFNVKTMSIKWYDSYPAGSLIQTDTIDLDGAATSTWYYKELRSYPPSNAESCEVVFTLTGKVGTETFYIDGVRLRQSGADTGERGAIDIRGTLRGAILTDYDADNLAPDPSDTFFGPAILPYWTSATGQVSSLKFGDYAGYKKWTDVNTQTLFYRRTLGSAGMSTNGFILFHARLILKATSNNNRFINPLLIKYGTATLFSWQPGGTGATNGNYVDLDFWVGISAAGSISNQVAEISGREARAFIAGTDPTTPTMSTFQRVNTVSVNPAVDTLTFAIYFTPNNTSQTVERLYVQSFGPFDVPTTT